MFGGVPTPFLGTPFKINQLGIMQFMQFLDLYFYDWKHQSAEDVSFGSAKGKRCTCFSWASAGKLRHSKFPLGDSAGVPSGFLTTSGYTKLVALDPSLDGSKGNVMMCIYNYIYIYLNIMCTHVIYIFI